ncbi:hypothetical protein M2164_005987 [Streptomyces sp. SAI-208]|uniref:hypothetical protein n=1 Tax=Streptomyces sp. SAI-208 TaxID=2940550 RepID=UPI00247488D0|nr:hypothetical protein [Streptomyces sp. SAI-208]MDH6610352.1 hypothetical protein [Streptomyces sp. SAI-208]
MNWGDVPTAAAVAVAAAALVVAIKARSDGRRAADASERSAIASEQAAADGRRSADAAEEALALQREAARPRVTLQIDRAYSGAHVLRNTGTAPARNLDLHPDDRIHVTFEDPLGDLGEGDVRPFWVTAAAAPPARLRLKWDGQSDYIAIAMP